MDQDPGNLINSFMGELHDRQRIIAEATESLYPQPESDDDGGRRKRKIIFGGVGLIKFLFLVLTREGMTLT